MRPFIAFTVASLVVLLAQPARPCSLMGLFDADLPVVDSTVGPRPTLFSSATNPYLVATGSDEPIALEPVPELADLDHQQRMTAWRPVAPLPAGSYTWFSWRGEITIFVDPELVDVPTIARADFHVTLSEPEDDAGCGEVDGCSDIDLTKLALDFSASAELVAVLIELRDPRGDARLELFTKSQVVPRPDPDDPSLELHDITIFDEPRGYPSFKSNAVCVALTGVSASGTLGERVELGCANPNDEGAHLTDARGCSAGHGGDGRWLALVVLSLWARARSLGSHRFG